MNWAAQYHFNTERMTEHLRRDDNNPSEDLRGSQPSAIILT